MEVLRKVAEYTHSGNVEFDISQITVDVTNNTFTFPSHGLTTSSMLTPLSNTQGNSNVSGGLTLGTRYYVVNPTTDTFQLSTSSGGAVIDITSVGDATGWKFEKTIATSPNVSFSNIGGINKFKLIISGAFASQLIAQINDISTNVYQSHAGSWASTIPLTTNYGFHSHVYLDGEVVNGYARFTSVFAVSRSGIGYTGITGAITSYNASFTGLNKFSLILTSNALYNGAKIQLYEYFEEQEIGKCPTISAIANVFTLDLSQLSTVSNFFIETTDAVSKSITFSNVPATTNRIVNVSVLLKYTNVATLTYPTGTTWKDGLTPNLTAGKKYVLMFTTFDGGTSWLGSWVGAW